MLNLPLMRLIDRPSIGRIDQRSIGLRATVESSPVPPFAPPDADAPSPVLPVCQTRRVTVHPTRMAQPTRLAYRPGGLGGRAGWWAASGRLDGRQAGGRAWNWLAGWRVGPGRRMGGWAGSRAPRAGGRAGGQIGIGVCACQ
jgi:hypothetical protein